MALKYVELKTPLAAIEAGILKKIGLSVINDKLFIDERMIKADKSSVGRKSKRKGGSFERKVATILSMWWSDGNEKDEFSKTPRSGAWKFPQDLVPPEHCPFLISCKNEESWTGIEKTMTTKHRFREYWRELNESLAEMSRNRSKLSLFEATTQTSFHQIIPMVIFTRNNETEYVMFKQEHIHRLEKHCGLFPKTKNYVTFTEQNTFNTIEDPIQVTYKVMMLNDFITWVTPNDVKFYVTNNGNSKTQDIKQPGESIGLPRPVPLL